MRQVSLVRVAAIVPVVRFLVRMGAPVERIFDGVLMPRDVLRDHEALIPYPIAVQFLEAAARADGIELLGALAGLATPIEALGTFGRRVAASATLHEALLTAGRIAAYYSGEVIWLEQAGDDVWLTHRFPRRIDDWHQQAEQYSLTCALRFLKSVAGPDWRPRAVCVPRGVPRAIADLELLQDTAVVFGESGWSIALDRQALRVPLPAPSGRSNTRTEWLQWIASAPARDLPRALGQVCATLLRAGDADIHLAARWLGTSSRTLQRRLEGAGVSYASVLANTRFATAVQRLADPDVRLCDIALELGYSDPAHFSRAFRRWSGRPPRAFRREARASHGQHPEPGRPQRVGDWASPTIAGFGGSSSASAR